LGYCHFAGLPQEGDWFDPVFVKAAANDATRITIAPKDNQHRI
jgi:hypothetical protein